MKTLLWIVLLASVAGIAAWAVGAWHWRSTSDRTRTALVTAATAAPARRVSFADLDGLPPPVQRYFRAVLQDGQPLARAAHLRQTGTFLTQPPDTWGPFTAAQVMTAHPAGFLWDARIQMAPGVVARVRDHFLRGEGAMYGALYGLVPVVDQRGTPAMAEGSLQRYLAEAAWCPTALLPAAGVVWTALDSTSARATLTADGVTAHLDVFFGPDSLIARVYTAARGRSVGDTLVPTPWEGRFGDYAPLGGVRIPQYGEVAWLLPEGPQPYWRGQITAARYE